MRGIQSSQLDKKWRANSVQSHILAYIGFMFKFQAWLTKKYLSIPCTMAKDNSDKAFHSTAWWRERNSYSHFNWCWNVYPPLILLECLVACIARDQVLSVCKKMATTTKSIIMVVQPWETCNPVVQTENTAEGKLCFPENHAHFKEHLFIIGKCQYPCLLLN